MFSLTLRLFLEDRPHSGPHYWPARRSVYLAGMSINQKLYRRSTLRVTQTLFRSWTLEEERSGGYVGSGRWRGAAVGTTKMMTVKPCTRLYNEQRAADKRGLQCTILNVKRGRRCGLVNVITIDDVPIKLTLAVGPTQNVNHATSCPSEFPPRRLSVFCFLLGAYAGVVATVLENLNEPSE